MNLLGGSVWAVNVANGRVCPPMFCKCFRLGLTICMLNVYPLGDMEILLNFFLFLFLFKAGYFSWYIVNTLWSNCICWCKTTHLLLEYYWNVVLLTHPWHSFFVHLWVNSSLHAYLMKTVEVFCSKWSILLNQHLRHNDEIWISLNITWHSKCNGLFLYLLF